MASAVFLVENIEPRMDPWWPLAGEQTHRAFWRAVVSFVLETKDLSLSKGLGRDGRPLKPISAYTRRHRKSEMGTPDPSAPPLTPAHGLSRTRAWLTGRAFPTHAEFFWKGGWGRILDYHRRGAGHLPIRDVIGLSYQDLVKVQRLANGWWLNWKKGTRVETQAEQFEFLAPAAVKVQPAPGKVAVVLPPPRKIAVVGSTDFENMTFGIGPGSGIERARAALDAGYHTGFRQFKAPKPPRGGMVGTPRANPNRPAMKRKAARSVK